MGSSRNPRVRLRVRSIPLMLTVLVLAGCAGTASAPAVNSSVDVSGDWAGTWRVGGGRGGFRMTLQQAGSTVTGHVPMTTGCGQAGALTGVVTATSLRWTAGCLSGVFWLDGDSMAGRMTGAVVYRVDVARQK
jgi:hypothetical protein